jgi:predicted RNA-binding Zn ribbon-like protein
MPSRDEVVDLLNSRPHAIPALPDTLDNPEIATEILGRFGEPAGGAEREQQLDRVRVLRADLSAVLEAAGPDAADRAWASFTAHTADALFQQTFPEAGLHQVAGDPVVGGIARAVADLVATNAWSRLRICDNGHCSRVFYDATRSRTQRWHSYELCGNRANVAAYRARAKS